MKQGELSCFWFYRSSVCKPPKEGCDKNCPAYKEADVVSWGGNPSNPIPNYDNGDCAED